MEAIKPRQIINYDAGIVLIDLHQHQRKNLTSRQYKSATLGGQPHVNEEQNPQNNNPQHPLSLANELNKLTSLAGKEVREFLSLGREACRRRLTSERTVKLFEMNIPRSSLRTRTMTRIRMMRGIAVIELQISPFLTVTDCVLALSQTK